MQPNFKRTRFACFFAYLSMASIFSLPPMLFLTFRESYGISYTLLGTLVLINFCTQMTVDLIFTFFAKWFNIKTTVRIMPLLTSVGLAVYALVPFFFSQYAYVGLVVGTVIFSVAAGLSEVLLSPLVASLPSENPERDMSALHSLYAYGVVTVVLLSTVFFAVFGRENWMYLTLFWAALPVMSSVLFCLSPFPAVKLSADEAIKGERGHKRAVGMALCVGCIFFGSCAENSMTNWISSYVESALGISKTLGDIVGLLLFGVLLGLTRTAYAKYGRNIQKVLMWGMAGAVVCYLTAALSPLPLLSLLACVLTGICTSMLWPGTLILMEEKFPNPGVAAYALMAAGGDLGASVAPQMLGVVVDTVSASTWGQTLASALSLSPERLGMKVGMLTAAVFPILGVLLLLYIRRYFKKNRAR
ncbi:MAG: MFS transporter [Ruminococcaceae bacterium]|nr:MFS transporter [Oscillospiraceae bacterium]